MGFPTLHLNVYFFCHFFPLPLLPFAVRQDFLLHLVEKSVENSASVDVLPLPSTLHPPPLPSFCQVSILRSTTIILSPTTEMDVALQFRGFIHPLWGAPPPAPAPTETVSMWARIQRLHFEARMASGPNSSQLVRERDCAQCVLDLRFCLVFMSDKYAAVMKCRPCNLTLLPLWKITSFKWLCRRWSAVGQRSRRRS